MPRDRRFVLNRSGMLLALIGAAFAGQAQAAAGRVEFAIGGATLTGQNGQQRPVTRGAEVESGDVVRTTDGRVQVRMADGAYISLQPNTEFGIKDYKYSGRADGTESAFYSLLKGAMRTVTGLIGRVNRNRYQVATPTATVGIRGTGGVIQVRDDGSTLVQGTSGIWFLANPSGSIDVPAGVSGVSPKDPGQPPKETGEPPTAGPAPLPPENEYVQGDQTETNGTAVITVPTPPVLVSGSGYSAAMAVAVAGVGSGAIPVVNGTGTATFNGAGQLEAVKGNNFSGLLNDFQIGGGSQAEFGTDGILAWGRWTGNVVIPAGDGTSFATVLNSNQGVHYVIGTPTATLPTSGTATYSLLGATSPTLVDGSSAPGTFSFAAGGGMTVVFFSGIYNVSISGAQVSIAGSTYVFGGAQCASGSSFSMPASVTSGCLSTCGSFVQGFFAGANAERAGLSYTITDSGGAAPKTIVGSAALTQ